MCHAKPVKRNRLLLSEVDEILMPFFETKTAASISSTTEVEGEGATATASATAAIPSEVSLADEGSTQPLTGFEKKEHGLKSVSGDRGEAGPDHAGGGPQGQADTRGGSMQQGGPAFEIGSFRAIESALEIDEFADNLTVTERPPKVTPPSASSSSKRIRFTGTMGSFLDGVGVWNDFAVMEAERKASEAQSADSGATEARACAYATRRARDGQPTGREDEHGKAGRHKEKEQIKKIDDDSQEEGDSEGRDNVVQIAAQGGGCSSVSVSAVASKRPRSPWPLDTSHRSPNPSDNSTPSSASEGPLSSRCESRRRSGSSG